MTRERSVIGPCLFLILMLWCFLPPLTAMGGPQASRKKSATVWVVFFFSQDCPRCESVRVLLKALKSSYPFVRLRVFDVARERDYELFRHLESIHSNEQFGVPLVMVGESILEGEDQIAAKLEKTVKRLSRAGGASLPYLGPHSTKKHVARGLPREKGPCQDKGGPPTLREELGKMRELFDKFF